MWGHLTAAAAGALLAALLLDLLASIGGCR